MNTLYARRRRLVRAIASSERRIEACRAGIVLVEADLLKLIPVVQPFKPRRYRLPITRDILECFRQAGSSLKAGEIARQIIEREAVPDDLKLRARVQSSVGACLRRLRDQGEVLCGEGRGAGVKWWLAME